MKIDIYSEKFLTLLQNILENEHKVQRPFFESICRQNYHNPSILCQNRHIEILQKMDINDDDSCLSDMEDDILKTCQITVDPKNINSASKQIVDNQKNAKKNIFEIKKEENTIKSLPVSNPNDENVLMKDSSSDTIMIDLNMQLIQQKEDIKKFEEFIQVSQTSKIYQPLRITYSSSLCETLDSRKISENSYMMNVDTDDFIENQSSVTQKEERQTFDPNFDPSSNLNAYKKTFVPKSIKTKEKLKNQVPFLKDFNPKFLKKENIDKKILRKFRNYVKVMYKEDKDYFENYDKNFWINFISTNLLPPMKYRDENRILIEFKSFNTQYLLWLFSKSGTVELYKEFSLKSGEELLQSFLEIYDLHKQEFEVIEKLKYYIYYMHDIYSGKKRNLLMNFTEENNSMCNLSYTTKLQSEDILDYYLGDYNNNFNKTFHLYNFVSYPRCGKKFSEQFRNEEDDYYDYSCIAEPVGLNTSFDSIQSVE
jgi:hypothetical protein